MTVARYSKRLLNPFTGTAQIIEIPEARAISSDGLHWRLHIRTAIFKMPWQDLAVAPGRDKYFVYGVWCAQRGLVKVPIHPTLYEEDVEEDATTLIELIKQHAQEIPFAPRDNIELWLFDPKEGLPIALIASRTEQDDLVLPDTLDWLPCKFDDTSFTSIAYASQRQMATNPLLSRDLVSAMVKQRVGQRASSVWVQRESTNQVKVLQIQCRHRSNTSEQLESMPFPQLLLTPQWADSEQQQLYTDYIAWLAPVLLTLPTLDIDTRTQLEQLAQYEPLKVYRLHRLYPTVCDRGLMNKILVEARLRGARQ
jgi:hypothetical protein